MCEKCSGEFIRALYLIGQNFHVQFVKGHRCSNCEALLDAIESDDYPFRDPTAE